MRLIEAADYATTMRMIYNQSDCAHGLLIEDDSIAAWDWYENLIKAIQIIEENKENWLCLKLFISYRFYDWLGHLPTVLSSLVFIVLIALIQCFIYHYLNVIIKYKLFCVTYLN